MRSLVLCAAGVLWLAGCAQDPLAERSIYGGLSPFERPSGPLVAVLEFDPATPDKQGLLYTAMRDAEVAATYAGRALARQGEPGETGEALAEVIFAVEPAAAPAWRGDGYAFGPNWASHGYGLRRSLDRMAAELSAAGDDGPAAAALREHLPPALRCTENTEGRAERVLSLSQEALADGGAVAGVPTLEQIKGTAEALNRGAATPDATACGLREVERQLDQLGPARTG
jgi:3',5'-cyclic AMP phosphodiesterase CpdA